MYKYSKCNFSLFLVSASVCVCRCYTGISNSQPLPAFIFKPSQSAFGVSVQQQGVWWVVLESHHLRGESLTFLPPRGSEVPSEGEAVVLGRLWCRRRGQDLASGLSTAFG